MTSIASKVLVGLLVLSCAASAPAKQCTAGQINTSFGNTGGGGFVQLSPWLTAFAGDLLEGAALDSAGRIHAPTAVAVDTDLVEYAGLLRVSADGVVDRSFGGFGLAAPGAQMAGQKGGRIALDNAENTLYALIGQEQASITRFLPNGMPDPDFGGNGVALIPLGGTWIVPGLSTGADRSVYLTIGDKNPAAANPQQPLVVKLTPQGALDTSFGVGGYARFFPPSYADPTSLGRSMDLVVLSSGQIIVAGRLRQPGPQGQYFQMFVARLQPNGTLDSSFGSNGFYIFDAGSSNNALGRRMVVQPDGKYLVSGSIGPRDGTSSNVAVFRVNPNGALDPGFGSSGGYALFALGESTFGVSLALQDNGKIVVGVPRSDALGNSLPPLVLRLTAEGQPDAAFGTAGWAGIDLSGLPGNAAVDYRVQIGMAPGGDIFGVVGASTLAGHHALFLTSMDSGKGPGCH